MILLHFQKESKPVQQCSDVERGNERRQEMPAAQAAQATSARATGRARLPPRRLPPPACHLACWWSTQRPSPAGVLASAPFRPSAQGAACKQAAAAEATEAAKGGSSDGGGGQ